MFQLAKRYEIQNGHRAIGVYPKLILFYFLQS